mmetsp:Transcript_11032/g.18008  ORF Transcript_11032/g.18008 Transcript_11032/m.18008 type:complete len:796 (+) Transcript_11032:58-2445(+)
MVMAKAGKLSRASQFDAYVKKTAKSGTSPSQSPQLGGECFSDEVQDEGGGWASCWASGSVMSVAAPFMNSLRKYCIVCLGVLLSCGMKFGWSLGDTQAVGYLMRRWAISAGDQFRSLHQIQFLSCISVCLLWVAATARVLSWRVFAAVALPVILCVCWGFSVRYSLHRMLELSCRAESLVRVYVNVIKKLQLSCSGQPILHPLPPMSRLEDLLHRDDGSHFNRSTLTMKSLRQALASALVDLETTLLSQFCTGFDSDFLAECLSVSGFDGSTTLVSVMAIMAKHDHVFNAVLPEILKSLLAQWSSYPVTLQPSHSCGDEPHLAFVNGDGNEPVLHSLLYIRGQACAPELALIDVLTPMVRSGVSLLKLYLCLRNWQESLLSLLPADLMEVKYVSETCPQSSPEGDTTEQVWSYGHSLTNTRGAIQTYGELRRQLASIRAASEDMSLRLWRCEEALAMAAPALLLASDETNPTSDGITLAGGACRAVLEAMRLLSGDREGAVSEGLMKRTNLDSCTSCQPEPEMRRILADARFGGILEQDMSSLLELMRDCVRTLQPPVVAPSPAARSLELTEEVDEPGGSILDGEEEDSADTMSSSSVYATHCLDTHEGAYRHVSLNGVNGNLDNLEGPVEVITGRVCAAFDGQSTTVGSLNKESSYIRGRQEEARRRRMQMMTELRGQIEILKEVKVLREHEREIPLDGRVLGSSPSSHEVLGEVERIPIKTREHEMLTALGKGSESVSASGVTTDLTSKVLKPQGRECEGTAHRGPQWKGLFQHEIKGVLAERHHGHEKNFLD